MAAPPPGTYASGRREIRRGDLVTGWLASANRDERAVPAPDDFDLARSPNRHLTFAHGPHFCLGAYLARAELSALLEALRDLVARAEPAGEARPVYSNFLSGLSSQPLTLIAEPVPVAVDAPWTYAGT
ncbi:cytochrome P450 [Streptomyces sp. NPDC005438]|uniref:cytochrome P450 n=1 Tax=Streptomyces sp. NPDC005438 TaxID=3156880 RepID=UPI0033A63399